jgi:hypothetical protein
LHILCCRSIHRVDWTNRVLELPGGVRNMYSRTCLKRRHTHTDTQTTYICTYTHPHIHIHTHTHTHWHTHTGTDTHICLFSLTHAPFDFNIHTNPHLHWPSHSFVFFSYVIFLYPLFLIAINLSRQVVLSATKLFCRWVWARYALALS